VGVSTARVHIGKFADFPPGFTSVVLPPGRIRKRLSKSEERTLSDTFDCVTPGSQLSFLAGAHTVRRETAATRV